VPRRLRDRLSGAVGPGKPGVDPRTPRAATLRSRFRRWGASIRSRILRSGEGSDHRFRTRFRRAGDRARLVRYLAGSAGRRRAGRGDGAADRCRDRAACLGATAPGGRAGFVASGPGSCDSRFVEKQFVNLPFGQSRGLFPALPDHRALSGPTSRCQRECRSRSRRLLAGIEGAAPLALSDCGPTTEARAWTRVLDRLSTAVWVVDEGARVLHANEAAQSLLRRNGPLRVVRGQLTSPLPAEASLFSLAVREAASGDFSRSTQPATIPLGDGNAGLGLIATVVPLREGAPAGDAAFAQDPADAPRTALHAFATLHGLTPGELRCLGVIALGRNVPEAAAALGIAPTTARTHLNNIFAKTGTASQVELVRLVAGFAAVAQLRRRGVASCGPTARPTPARTLPPRMAGDPRPSLPPRRRAPAAGTGRPEPPRRRPWRCRRAW